MRLTYFRILLFMSGSGYFHIFERHMCFVMKIMYQLQLKSLCNMKQNLNFILLMLIFPAIIKGEGNDCAMNSCKDVGCSAFPGRKCLSEEEAVGHDCLKDVLCRNDEVIEQFCQWTDWQDHDNPGGVGDFESAPDNCIVEKYALQLVDGGTVYNNTNDIDFQNMHEAGDGSVYCTNAGEISEPCQDWQAKYCCAPKPKPKCKCCKAKPKVCCEDNGCSTAHPGFQCMNETAAANHPKTCMKHDTALCGKKKNIQYITEIKISTDDISVADCTSCFWMKVCQNSDCCSTPIFPGEFPKGSTRSFSGSELGACENMVINDFNAQIEATFHHVASTMDAWKGTMTQIRTDDGPYKCPMTDYIDSGPGAYGPSTYKTNCKNGMENMPKCYCCPPVDPPNVCTDTENTCSNAFDGAGSCVDITKPDWVKLDMEYDIYGPNVPDACRASDDNSCCRCLKNKVCMDTGCKDAFGGNGVCIDTKADMSKYQNLIDLKAGQDPKPNLCYNAMNDKKDCCHCFKLKGDDEKCEHDGCKELGGKCYMPNEFPTGLGSQSLVDPVTGSGPFYCNKKMDCRCMKQGCQNKACREKGGKCLMPSDTIPFGYQTPMDDPFFCDKELNCKCYLPPCKSDACDRKGGKCVMPNGQYPNGWVPKFYCNKETECQCYLPPCENDRCQELGGVCMMPSIVAPNHKEYQYQFYCNEDLGCKCYLKVIPIVLWTMDEIDMMLIKVEDVIREKIKSFNKRQVKRSGHGSGGQHGEPTFPPGVTGNKLEEMQYILSYLEEFVTATNASIEIEFFKTGKELISSFLNDLDDQLAGVDVDTLGQILDSILDFNLMMKTARNIISGSLIETPTTDIPTAIPPTTAPPPGSPTTAPPTMECKNDDCTGNGGQCIMPGEQKPQGWEMKGFCNQEMQCKCYAPKVVEECENAQCTNVKKGICVMPDKTPPANSVAKGFCNQDMGCKCYVPQSDPEPEDCKSDKCEQIFGVCVQKGQSVASSIASLYQPATGNAAFCDKASECKCYKPKCKRTNKCKAAKGQCFSNKIVPSGWSLVKKKGKNIVCNKSLKCYCYKQGGKSERSLDDDLDFEEELEDGPEDYLESEEDFDNDDF